MPAAVETRMTPNSDAVTGSVALRPDLTASFRGARMGYTSICSMRVFMPCAFDGILHETFPTAMRLGFKKRYLALFAAFLATAQVRDSSLRPNHAASLTIEVRHATTGELVPARVYLFRGATPHRLSPVDNLLPLFEDN